MIDVQTRQYLNWQSVRPRQGQLSGENLGDDYQESFVCFFLSNNSTLGHFEFRVFSEALLVHHLVFTMPLVCALLMWLFEILAILEPENQHILFLHKVF